MISVEELREEFRKDAAGDIHVRAMSGINIIYHLPLYNFKREDDQGGMAQETVCVCMLKLGMEKQLL